MLTEITHTPGIIGLHQSKALGASVFSPAMPTDTVNFLMVQALTQNIRFTLSNGQAPSATVGFVLTAGDFPAMIPMGDDFTPQFYPETTGAILQYQWIY